MSNPQAAAVFEVTSEGFAQLGLSAPTHLHRTFLLRNMEYAGQRFHCDGWQAVWLLGSNSIDFYDEEGNLIKTIEFCGEEGNPIKTIEFCGEEGNLIKTIEFYGEEGNLIKTLPVGGEKLSTREAA